MNTKDKIIAMLCDSIENRSIPRQILEILTQFDGQKLFKSKKILCEIDPSVKIQAEYGMTQIHWTFRPDPLLVPDDGIVKTNEQQHSIIVAYSTKAIIDCEWIKSNNTGYFDCLDERNSSRMLLLKDADLLEKFATAVDDYQRARKQFLETVTYDSVYGCGFDSKLRELAGFRS